MPSVDEVTVHICSSNKLLRNKCMLRVQYAVHKAYTVEENKIHRKYIFHTWYYGYKSHNDGALGELKKER